MAKAEATVAAVTMKQKTFGEKMTDFLGRNPDKNDVVFCVGPQKKKVKALRLALMASSPVMEKMFNENWDTAVMKEGEGIPLPDLEPVAFEYFIKLLMSDAWSTETIKEMAMSAETVFNVLKIVKHFVIPELENLLQQWTQKYFVSFSSFVKTSEFLALSRATLKTILSSELLLVDEIEIFQCAVKWAHSQHNSRGLDVTGENLRAALGGALFQIRFPLMCYMDFVKVVCPTKILLDAEELGVFRSIAFQNENIGLLAGALPFKTESRGHGISLGLKKLVIFKGSPIISNPYSVACDNIKREIWFQVNKKIAVESVRFFGSTSTLEDSRVEVTVEACKRNSVGDWNLISKVNKQVRVQPLTAFDVAFDTPVVFEATYTTASFISSRSPYYGIFYTVTGSNVQIQSVQVNVKNFRMDVDDVGFYLHADASQLLSHLNFKICETP